MAIVISDPALVAKFAVTADAVEICDLNGNYLGTFAPPIGKPPAGYVPPIPADELARRRTIREGKPLSEILERLQESR